jgi:acyl-CoA dehydrogenase
VSAAELRDLIADIAAAHTEPPAGELPACWPTLVELGLPLVGIEEDRGGSGGSVTDLSVLVRALGRHAISTPLIECAVANWVVATARGEAGPGLRTISAGGAAEGSAESGVEGSAGSAVAGSAAGAFGGSAAGAFGGSAAGAVDWARHAGEIVIYRDGVALLADARASGVTIEPGTNVAGEPVDEIRLDAADLVALAGAPSADAVRTRLGLLRAAALTGAVAGAYELTRAHVTTREQFGRPLVRIPAVAANLAMIKAALIESEAALARVSDASLASVAVARIIAGRAATRTARIAHQLHGAIGVTAEYSLHRFTKRLWAWRDADTTEHDWSVLLGEAAAAGGEAAFWDELTPAF